MRSTHIYSKLETLLTAISAELTH